MSKMMVFDKDRNLKHSVKRSVLCVKSQLVYHSTVSCICAVRPEENHNTDTNTDSADCWTHSIERSKGFKTEEGKMRKEKDIMGVRHQDGGGMQCDNVLLLTVR